MSTVLERFKAANLENLPSLGAMSDDMARVFWVLLIGRDRAEQARMTAHEIGIVLQDVYAVMVPRQRITGLLDRERRAVARMRRGGQTEYQLMDQGAQIVLQAGPDVVFIQPEQALSGIRTVESMLQSLEGEVRVCDPWIDGRSLDLLSVAVNARAIRLMTANIPKPGPFSRDLAAFRQQHVTSIEVRVASGKILHDRYVIDERRMLILGTSLNGIGAKQTFVVSTGEDVRSMALAAFDALWGKSQPV
jgi:hypothetical protein